MEVHKRVHAALRAALPSVWLSQLPDGAQYPAAAYEIDSEPQEGWCQGRTVYEHMVGVLLVADTATQVSVLQRSVLNALPGIVGYMEDGTEVGDADYESEAKKYAKYISFKIREVIND